MPYLDGGGLCLVREGGGAFLPVEKEEVGCALPGRWRGLSTWLPCSRRAQRRPARRQQLPPLLPCLSPPSPFHLSPPSPFRLSPPSPFRLSPPSPFRLSPPSPPRPALPSLQSLQRDAPPRLDACDRCDAPTRRLRNSDCSGRTREHTSLQRGGRVPCQQEGGQRPHRSARCSRSAACRSSRALRDSYPPCKGKGQDPDGGSSLTQNGTHSQPSVPVA